MKQEIDNLIFYSQTLDIRKGGPSGYIANLKEKLNTNDKIIIISRTKYDFLSFSLAKFLIKLIPFSSYRRKLRAKFKSATFVLNKLPLSFTLRLNRYRFKTIICHSVWDIKMVKKYLEKYNIDAKLMLMSHTPTAPSLEYWESLSPISRAFTSLEHIQKIEKESFELADILIFPSKEATEPYLADLAYFNDLLLRKKIYFIPTGAKQIPIHKNHTELKKEYGIQTKYVVCYLGRHNKIKGYDILENIAKKVLAKRKDITFLIAGNISKDIPPLDHPKWIELGRTHPSNVFSISDLFILPNKQTYFDLVLLEALSAGLPVLASYTGGNKSVYRQTHAIKLYHSEDNCIEEIEKFFSLSVTERHKISTNCLNAYLHHYTPEVFAENYKKLINNILKEIKNV